jgi:hypothetical protein
LLFKNIEKLARYRRGYLLAARSRRPANESLEDVADLPEPAELATDAIAELEGRWRMLTAVLTLLENGAQR